MSDKQADDAPTEAPKQIQEPTTTNRSRERAKLVIEALTLAAVVFYGAVAYCQWRAMTISNEQTKTALHVAERAYITTDTPTFDLTTKFLNFSITNSGHIPSGNIEIAVHEATVNPSIPNLPPDVGNAVEYHWKRHKLSSLPPGKGSVLLVPIRAFSEDKFTPQGAYQAILVAGRVGYYDGFPDDPLQQWSFCFQSVYHLTLTKIFLVSCDAELVIPQMKNRDGYPRNEAND